MINLLPPELKSDYRYARRNAKLLHVILIFAVGFVGLAAITAAGALYIQQASNTYAAQAEEIRQDLAAQKQDEIKAQAQDVSNNLKLAVQVLSQQVLFSQLLKQLAVAIPSNTSLTGITLSELDGAVDISARATSYSWATQLQVNLADPDNKIFTGADIISINCSSESEATDEAAQYPCSVSIRARFATDNPFLLINEKADAQ